MGMGGISASPESSATRLASLGRAKALKAQVGARALTSALARKAVGLGRPWGGGNTTGGGATGASAMAMKLRGLRLAGQGAATERGVPTATGDGAEPGQGSP